MAQSNRRIGLAISFLMAMLVTSKPSYALDLAIVGAGTGSRPYLSSNISNSLTPYVGLGGGILADLELNNYFSLQLGSVYTNQSYSNQVGGGSTITQLQYLQFPVELKYWLTPWLALGGGGYYSAALGKAIVTSGSTISNTTFSNFGLKSGDYGVMASVSASIPLGSRVSVYLEPQYIRSLDNALTSGGSSNFTFRDVQMLIGFRFRGVLDSAPEYYQDYEFYSRRYY